MYRLHNQCHQICHLYTCHRDLILIEHFSAGNSASNSTGNYVGNQVGTSLDSSMVFILWKYSCIPVLNRVVNDVSKWCIDVSKPYQKLKLYIQILLWISLVYSIYLELL